jgi:hypothetical protein
MLINSGDFHSELSNSIPTDVNGQSPLLDTWGRIFVYVAWIGLVFQGGFDYLASESLAFAIRTIANDSILKSKYEVKII